MFGRLLRRTILRCHTWIGMVTKELKILWVFISSIHGRISLTISEASINCCSIFNMSQDNHEVSLHRAGLTKRAAGKLKSRAKSMKAAAMKKGDGKVFEVGEVVFMPLVDIN
jgi:hypothetical protein